MGNAGSISSTVATTVCAAKLEIRVLTNSFYKGFESACSVPDRLVTRRTESALD